MSIGKSDTRRRVYENLLQHTYLRGVDIVPGSLDLMAYDLGVLNGNPQRRAAIRDFAAALAEDDAYDYLLVDCPPAFSASRAMMRAISCCQSSA